MSERDQSYYQFLLPDPEQPDLPTELFRVPRAVRISLLADSLPSAEDESPLPGRELPTQLVINFVSPPLQLPLPEPK